MRHLALACLTVLTLAACQSHDEDKTATAPAPAPARPSTAPPPPLPAVANEHHEFTPDITAADFAAHLRTLSSDEYDGRKPGTLGERLTTNYIIEQFKRAGLEPGNKGEWIQTVPAVSTALTGQDSLTLDVTEGGGTERFAFGTDMVAGTLQAKAEVDLQDSDVVFVGYGVDAPESQWNDFDGLDVKGKTLVMLVNDPGWNGSDANLFKGREMTYYGRWTYKFEEAARKGAAAAFIVHQTEPAGYAWNVVRSGWTTPRLDLPESEDPAPRLPVAGWLTHDAAVRLFAKAGKNFDELAKQADVRGFKPVPLDAKATLHLKSTITHSLSNNVIGMVKGSEKPDEAVVYTAHWDHLGHDPALKGHQIYNGAIDNGTGIAAMLEIAAKFAQEKPKRSVVFAAVTMEESGLLGSKYYVAHPPFPLAKTVADINMDALAIGGATHDMTVEGHGQNDLEDMLADVLKADGRVVSGDTAPEKGYYFRSDHFNFAKAGVPALAAGGGIDMVDGGKAAGMAAEEDYGKNRYHQPTDVYDMRWNFDGVMQNVKAFYGLGEKLADSDVWPVWKDGSEFKAVREKSLADGAKKKK